MKGSDERIFTVFLFLNIALTYFFLFCPCLIYSLGFPCGSAGEESACRVGDLGLIPGLGRFPRDEKGYLLQYSGLELGMTERLSLFRVIVISKIGLITIYNFIWSFVE